jgi:hypothetical protein
MRLCHWPNFSAQANLSTLVEIQDAVEHLPSQERKALQLWLNSQAESEISALEKQRLLRSLDEAIRDLDAGQGVAINPNAEVVVGQP